MQMDKEQKKFGLSPFYKQYLISYLHNYRVHLTFFKKSLTVENKAIFDHKAILQAHL